MESLSERVQGATEAQSDVQAEEENKAENTVTDSTKIVTKSRKVLVYILI